MAEPWPGPWVAVASRWGSRPPSTSGAYGKASAASDARTSAQGAKRFTKIPGQIVVPDTSAFIEGVYYADFDWHLLDGIASAHPVRLIVPILVIEELDVLKRDRSGRLGGRARSVLRQMWKLHSGDPACPPTRQR